MLLKETLLRHLEIDFIYGDKDSLDCFRFLNEERGHVPSIDKFVNPILEKIKREWTWRSSELKFDISVYGDSDAPFFFNDFSCTVVQGCELGGNYVPMQNNFDEETQNLKKMVMRITLVPKVSDLFSIIRVILYHEFLHAWEDVNRFRQKRESLRDVIKNSRKNINRNVNYNENLKFLSYFLSYTEKNAYIGELKADLIKNQDEIMDSKSGLEALEKSNVYKNLVKAGRYIKTLKDDNIKKNKNEIVIQWYELTNEEFSDYDAFVNYIIKKYNKFCKKFISVAHKTVYDVFRENGNEVIVDNFNDYFE